ncbi:MAG TPA: VOC family protein [Lacibacter sp.]|nr:VOC family protein [Lacibacter sp.]
MILEHIAIWTGDIERLKEYYVRFFEAVPNAKYINTSKEFESYFLSFKTGARLEIMKMKGVPDNLNDTVHQQHKGIIHLAFGVDTMTAVDAKAKELAAAGFPILNGPRKTGDGYYEFETLDPDLNRLEVTTLWRS